MKTVDVKVLNLKLEKCLREAQKDDVVVTRNGKPLVVMLGVKGKDLEQVELGLDPEFWKMIQRRRKQKTIPLAEVERQLNGKTGRG